MCCIFTPAWAPFGTYLILVPLASHPGKWFLTYVNSAENRNQDVSKPMLMVVPVPNPGGAMAELDFLLGETKGVKEMLKAAVDSFASYEPPKELAKSRGARRGMGAPGAPRAASFLLVQDVGEYNVTVAPSLERLVADVQWDRFDVPDDARKAILADMAVKFGSEFAFVIAQTKPGHLPNDSGFGVAFDSPVPFWPTAHEVQLGADGTTEMPAAMDVICVGINCVPDRESCRRAVFTNPGKGAWTALGAANGAQTLASLDAGVSEDKVAGLSVMERAKAMLSARAEAADNGGGKPRWDDHPKGDVADAEDLGPPDCSPVRYSVEDGVIASTGAKCRWPKVVEVLKHLPTEAAGERAGTPLEYEAPSLACAWALGQRAAMQGALARDPASFYTNSNVTGRRATEADVQKLREVLAANAKDFPTMDETSARYLNEGLARVGAEIEFGHRGAAGA